MMQHTVRAKPDGIPRLEGCATITIHVTHTLAHTYLFPLASALDHYEVSAPRSRVG